jgi:Ice-binding-like
MPNALAINGAQAEKPTKATPLYVGRIFSGLWTNRSPLRDANTSRVQEKYYGPSGDAMIAGANVEVTTRLTLARRPGNPIYDAVNQYTDILSFDEFRYSKALSDAWGTQIEQIDTMVDTVTALHANTNGIDTLVWTKTPKAGQSFMQEVGSQLYFGNGIDQKKWNQSLFVRQASNNSTLINNAAYPFMNTYIVVPVPFTTPVQYQIQQLIGAQLAVVTGIQVNNNVLTVTIANPLGTSINGAPFTSTTPGTFNQAKGTMFMLWRMGAASFLEGATIKLNAQYVSTGGGDMTLTAAYVHPNVTVTGLNGILQIEKGVLSGVADTLTPADVTIIAGSALNPGVTTGTTVPVWGTTAPSFLNNFEGSITVDGNAIWINRGDPVENWGILPPSLTPTFVATGSEVGWAANTYYSIASIFQDIHGYLWQISTPGLTSTGANPLNAYAGPYVPQVKVNVNSVAVSVGGVVTLLTTNPSVAFTPGEVLSLGFLNTATALNGQTITISTATTVLGVTTIVSTVTSFSSQAATPDSGVASLGGFPSVNPTTTVTDGAAVWSLIQTPTQTTWQANTHYNAGDFIAAVAGGVLSFFQLATGSSNLPTPQPNLVILPSPITAYDYEFVHSPTFTDGTQGYFQETFPAPAPTSTNTVPSLYWRTTNWPSAGGTAPMLVYQNYPVDGSGNPLPAGAFSFGHNNGGWAITANIYIPVAGSYTFSLTHQSGGAFFSFDDVTNNNCSLNQGSGFSDSAIAPHTVTAKMGFGSGITPGSGQNLCGTNKRNVPPFTPVIDTATWVFTVPGTYMVEIDYVNWDNNGNGGPGEMLFQANGLNLAGTPSQSGTATPNWPPFTLAGATYNAAIGEIVFGTSDIVHDGPAYTWVNIGPVSDFAWYPGVHYTLPGTNIVDSNGFQEGAIETGVTGTTPPTWNKAGLNSITTDNGTLKWINEGNVVIRTIIAGTITATSTQGFIYAIALVNTLDNTVSNIGPLSAATGPIVNGQVTFAPGAGLANVSIDPQVDYVAIFRTADGFPTELLIAGFGNTIYTVPLVQYLQNGFVDTTLDIGLDIQAPAPAAFENTPPLPGAINLTYHLNRIFYSTGNTVFWTSGPLAPIGNGINGFGPNNYDKMPSLVKRLVPTALGLMVLTVSDIYMIPDDGQGTIEPSYVYAAGVGISSYNALDWNGPTIGFFTTDSQFLTFSPSAGGVIDSVPIADQFTLRNGHPGQNWFPANVYVASYTSGQDVGWFVADGMNGWYRFINNPAPDLGQSWSPFAAIAAQGGVKAIKAVETSPGVHHLLLGAPNDGAPHYILYRDTTSSTDGGTIVSTPATPPANHLGTAFGFDILAGSAITGSAGAGSTIAGGNIGIYPNNASSVTNFPPSVLVSPGVFNYADPIAIQAQTDLGTAITYYSGLPATLSGLVNLSTSGNGVNNHTYTAGVYKGGSSLDIPTSITLDAQGNSGAIFVFVAGSTITLESGASVILANGAQAGNVYWVCGSAFTSIWNGIQSDMVGTIMAYSGITLGGGTLHGRALSTTAGFVTLTTTETITFPTLTSTPGTGVIGTPYPAYAVFGSYVLAQPGQVANVQFITLKSVLTGSPAVLGLLLDDGLPYYKGSFEILKIWVNDPPELKPSRTWYSQRFYLSDMPEESAAVTDLQIMVQWPAEAAINELQTFTIFGSYVQEG